MTVLALLHSPFLPAELSWGDLPAALTALGHDVTVVSVTDDEPPRAVSAYAFSAARQLPPEPLVLLAHGAAGPLVPVVVTRRDYGRVLGAVFVDATLPGLDQDSRLGLLQRQDEAAATALARRLYAGGLEPLGLPAGARPRPLAFFTEPIPVPGAGWSDLRWAYLQTGADGDAEAARAAALGRPVLRRDTVDASDVDALITRLLAEAPRHG